MTTILFLAALVQAAGWAAAQQQVPRFTQLTRDHGLSDNSVEAIVEDRQGFMWLGTADGLNRFDAYSFTVYRHDPSDPRSLSQNFVSELLEDSEGVLWVGTLDGLNRYDRDTDSFTHYRNEEQDSSSLSNDVVYVLYESHDGGLWVGTIWGLNRYDGAATGRGTGTFVRYTFDEHIAAGTLREPYVRALAEDRQGHMWAGLHGGGLIRLDPQAGTSRHYLPRKDHADSLSHADVWSLLTDRDGHLWVGTHGGLNRYDPGSDSFVRFLHDVDDPSSLGNDHIDALYEDRDGLLWIGTDGGGLDVFDRQANTFNHYRRDPSDETSLGSDVVRTIYEDRKGDLWIGAYTGGVNFYNRSNTAFSYYRHLADSNSLSDSRVLCFFEDEGGIVWIGTEDGLNRFDPGTQAFRSYRHDERDPRSLSAAAVLSILEDSRGRFWVGTFYGGLNRFDRQRGTFSSYQPDPYDRSSLSDPHVWDILEDRTGQLWLATFGGLNRLDDEAGKFTRFLSDPDDEHSLSHNLIWSLYEDSGGTLWIATHGGLAAYDRALDGFRTYRHDEQDGTSLSRDQVLTVLEDRQRRLWVGTDGGGLNLFDRQAGTFTAFRTADGMPSDVVFGIVEDDDGQLWLSTNDGLTRFDPRTATFVNYDKSDGLLAHPFYRSSLLKSRSGEIFVGGTHGFNSFFPGRVQDNTYLPSIVLTDFQIFNQSIAVSDEGPLERPIMETEHIRLRHDQSVISFAFSALNYRAPEKNRYSYKLENFDREWTKPDTKRAVTYTNLDPGDYVFRVKGSNNSGLWNEEGAAVRIEVSPPYWATWWFRAAGVLAAAALLFGVYQSRMRKIGERRRVQAERQRLLGEMEVKNAELEAKNLELERFSYTVSHDLKSPLVTVKGFVGLLEKDALAGKMDRVKDDVAHINGAVAQMGRLLDELLELSRAGRLVNPPRPVALTELAREAIALLAGPLEERGVAVDVEPQMPPVMADYTRLVEVFQNLIGNAVKFMGEQAEPRIEVGASVDGSQVSCFVRDNGIGIDPESVDKVFTLFERLDAEVDGTGIGLALVKRIVEVHGGRIWVESEGRGHGSTFRFTLPSPS